MDILMWECVLWLWREEVRLGEGREARGGKSLSMPGRWNRVEVRE